MWQRQRGDRMPVPGSKIFQRHPPPTNDAYLKKRKRMIEDGSVSNLSNLTSWQEGLERKRQEVSSNVVDYSDPLIISNVMEKLDPGKYGSVTKEIKDLTSRRQQLLMNYFAMDCTHPSKYLNLKPRPSKVILQTERLTSSNVIDVDDDSDTKAIVPLQAGNSLQARPSAGPLVILDSDDDEPEIKEVSQTPGMLILNNQGGKFMMKDFEVQKGMEHYPYAKIELPKKREMDLTSTSEATESNGAYVGVEDDEDDDEHPTATDDGLGDIWKEMSFAMEASKETDTDPSSDEKAAEEPLECDHSFILKDDIGYVCRVCGIIQRSIETIIEYQFTKAKNTRTYRYDGRTSKDSDQTDYVPGRFNVPAHDFAVADIAAHPRHRKQMKPHQIEGFNFLLSNLVTDSPGGCIMAHAPGSGKTFMIISFLQSFMAKYPFSRPLVVLPRGILPIWKKEFQRWQIEDFPLYDFYSVKADSRAQQLEVLKLWADQRSILFLGYKQFSSIVCDTDCGKAATTCQEILLTQPSILILDEGHTPRNKDTDIVSSLERVQTPRKVVLSGTLYQNHVEEVFNILNLVRPKFLQLENSKGIKRRIMSKISMSTRRDISNKCSAKEFYDAVEHTLVKDTDFNRKVSVIKELREMTRKVLHYYRGDFLDELPGLVDFTLLLKLRPKQQQEVVELKKLRKKFKISSAGSALYVHPDLKSLSKNPDVKERVDVEKIDMIVENLDVKDGVKAKFYLNLLKLCESSGEKLLVFSQFLLPLKFLERLTLKVFGYATGKEMFMITGESDNDQREIAMEMFNTSPDARVFFGSIKACGEGVSLVGASRVLILDVHMNPSVTRQAIGRAFRPGQEKKVYVYRLVAAASPEEADHDTCFRKECIAKMWFEWNEFQGHRGFNMEEVKLNECDDKYLEIPRLREDVISVYLR
ncbi:OLC1v1000156C1 [Oldenlandia corymbosa var. corymbosa]|uniref:OLC1v1000156C1 n=1 Tax=Oldenlandia corymbosa var. corymbosa TaxID=529605 RepID=A0AAV1D3P6_OLDCO|nr:OLC1v1000156C1 [Oldenlandia corymbosa var. corymbosa]